MPCCPRRFWHSHNVDNLCSLDCQCFYATVSLSGGAISPELAGWCDGNFLRHRKGNNRIHLQRRIHEQKSNVIIMSSSSSEPSSSLKLISCINKFCPRSGKPVPETSLTQYRGLVVGFCNPGCRDEFEADYAANPEACPTDRQYFDTLIKENGLLLMNNKD